MAVSTTVRALITSVLRELNVISNYDNASGIEATQALHKMNLMIDAWNADSLWSYTYLEITGTLPDNNGSYTIGPDITDDIQVPYRPSHITGVQLEHGAVIYPLEYISNKDWSSMTRVTSSSSPCPQYYRYLPNPNYPSGLIELYQAPTSALPYRIQFNALIDSYELDDIIDLPPGYYSLLEAELTYQLGLSTYGINNAVYKQIADSRKRIVFQQNNEMVRSDLSSAPRGSGGRGRWSMDVGDNI